MRSRLSTIGRAGYRIFGSLVVAAAGVVLGINLYVNLPALPPTPTSGATVGYFAYGANMHDRYLTRVRGVCRIHSERAVLPDYSVAFNLKGITFLEPAFANLVPEPKAVAYGVLHTLPADQLDKITNSEGAAYQIKEVAVFLEDGSSTVAKTLIAENTLESPLMPSRRYLQYLQEAATTYEMPPDVIRRYDPRAGAHVPLLSQLLGATLHTAVWMSARF